MFGTRRTREFLLVLACCFALGLVPLSAAAQDNILKKGAHGVKKGVETGAEKTKEGAEAVGHGVKKAVTGEDTNTERTYTTQEPSKPTTAPSTTAPSKSTTGTMPAKGTTSGTEKHPAKGTKELPSTAGELPLLALIGSLALAASGTLKLVRRKN